MESKHNAGVIDMSSGKKEGAVNAMDMFNTKRVDGEVNLVDLIGRDFITAYNATASAAFMNSLEIIQVTPLNPLSQRIIINRWFINKLLIYRAFNNDVEVGEVMSYVINDGTIDDWHDLLFTVVIPFFKIKDVLVTIPVPTVVN